MHIRRHSQFSQSHSFVAGSGIGRDGQIAVFVVTARCTHSVDKVLLQLIDGLIGPIAGGRSRPRTLLVQNLVETFKDKLFSVVLETFCYLFPNSLILRGPSGIIPHISIEPPFLAGIVHHIDDAIATGFQHIVYHFFHTCHPSLINLVVGIQMRPPRDRHTNDVETFGGNAVYHLLSGIRLPP